MEKVENSDIYKFAHEQMRKITEPKIKKLKSTIDMDFEIF